MNLRHRATTMDTLISLGVSAAYAWSLWALLSTKPGAPEPHLYFEVAAVVTTFILAGRFFVQHHARLWLHQDDFKTWLAFNSHRQPAKVFADHGVSVDFEAQLIAIKLERFLLVLNPNENV